MAAFRWNWIFYKWGMELLMQQNSCVADQGKIQLKCNAALRKIVACSIFLALVFSYIFSERSAHGLLYFSSTIFYVLLTGIENLPKMFAFIKNLYLKRRALLHPGYLQQLSIKKMLFPEFFALTSAACFLLLIFGSQHSKILNKYYGLFIPVLLLGFSSISTLFLRSTHQTIVAWRRLFIKKIYLKNPFLVKTYVLASYVLALGLVVAYSSFIFKNHLQSLDWYCFGFFDKRIVYMSYLLIMFGFLFVPYFYSAFAHRNSLPVPLKNMKLPGSFFKKVICFGIAFVIATYFWGPPWNVGLYTEGPDLHEVVHLGPLLAIKQGRIPFTEALTQYGPGTQFFQYLYLEKFGFDLLHLRESNLVFHYVFVLILFLSIWFYLKPLEAAIASAFCLIFPFTLSGFSFSATGVPIGFFGWFNGFRYLGPPVLAMAMGHLFTQNHLSRVHPFLIGCLYGFLLYMAQENFACGIVTLIVGSMLAYMSKYVTLQELRRMGFYFLLGILMILSPVFGFYIYHHQLGEFIRQYFKVSSAVVHGFSNTPWSSGVHDAWFLPYVLTPVVLFAIGFYNLYCNKKQSFLLEKNSLKTILLTISAIALYQISLFRADSSHYMATCLTLPILFGLVFCNILRGSAISKMQIIGSASLFLLFFISIYPTNLSIKTLVPVLKAPLNRYFVSAVKPSTRDQVFFERFGFYRDPNSKSCSYNAANTAEFVSEMTAIKEIVGEKATIVGPLTNNITSSIYFFADLKIGTKIIDNLLSIINSQDREKLIQEIDENHIQCLITSHLHEKEAVAFLKRFPHATQHCRVYDNNPYYILCDDSN